MIYFIGNNVDYINIQHAEIEDLVEFLSDQSEVGFDTETTGFDPRTSDLLSYQIGNNKVQFVVDAIQYPIELIEDSLKDKLLIIHNAKFDLRFLYHRGIYPTKIWDTYLAECVLYKGDRSIRKALDVVVDRYLHKQLNKTVRGKIISEKFSERVIRYGAEDVEYLPDVKIVQEAKLSLHDLTRSMSLENEFVKVLTYIEYSGIPLDVEMWKKKVEQDIVNRNDKQDELNQWIINNKIYSYIDNQLDLFDTTKKTIIDWSSPVQVASFFKTLGIDTKVSDEKTGELKDSVDAKVLEKQKDQSTIIPLYLDFKKYEKIVSTYGETIFRKIHPVTGRIHTSFTQILDTGRMSSGGKLGREETINLQNIPRLPGKDERVNGKIYERECFRTKEGYVFIDADYSGQEQIVFANWTQDPDILKFYSDNLGDMHSFVASKIYPYLHNVPLKTIKNEYKKERQIAKSAGFAINYGGDGNTIADNLNLSKEEGNKIYEAYFQAFPGVSNYFKRTTEQALRDGYILFNDVTKDKCFISFFDKYKTLEHRISSPGFWEVYREEKAKDSLLYKRELKSTVSRYFKLKGNISRMALNYPIQGSSANITKLACIFIFDYLIKNDLIGVVLFDNVIHDEILLECPENLAETMKKVVEDCMEKAGRVYCKIVPLTAEASICKFWNH
jgi:DNA polymerase I-like protein with 3'-5' exonuclease and polymerase domains